MKNLKKTVRLISLVLFIVLASVGIGIGGAIPISANKKGENTNEVKIELVLIKEDKTKLVEIKNVNQS